MSITSIKQNAQSIIDAYSKLISKQDKDKEKKLKNYILKLSDAISEKVKQERKNVS